MPTGIGNWQSEIGNALAGFSQPLRFFDEVVTASAAQFLYISFFDRKKAAGIGPVLVNAAEA